MVAFTDNRVDCILLIEMERKIFIKKDVHRKIRYLLCFFIKHIFLLVFLHNFHFTCPVKIRQITIFLNECVERNVIMNDVQRHR